MQPGQANVGAAMIAHGAEHPRLQISIGHVVGEPADVHLGVVMTVRIAAIDEHMPWLRMLASRTGLLSSTRFGIVQGMPH